MIGLYLQPMTLWLWIGGAIIAIGTLLAALPGRRRRPTDPSTVATADAVPVTVGAAEQADG